MNLSVAVGMMVVMVMRLPAMVVVVVVMVVAVCFVMMVLGISQKICRQQGQRGCGFLANQVVMHS